MGKDSHIEWTDHTFNPWIGCTKVSPGCANCYAEAMNVRWSAGVNWGKGAPRRRTSAGNWTAPVKWNRDANYFGFECAECSRHFHDPEALGNPWECPHCGVTLTTRRSPRVFCASLADWLDDEVPIEWLADLLKLIHDTPNLDWLLLTKRPENWRERMCRAMQFCDRKWLTGETHIRTEVANWLGAWVEGTAPHRGMASIPSNIWIGTTVEDQKRANERVPALLQIPARVRFLSCEPLLTHVHLATAAFPSEKSFRRDIHWVICGGESGSGARPMHPDWALSLHDQCQAAGVPFFFKQWGEWCPRGPESLGYHSVEGVPRIRLTDAGCNGSELGADGDNDVWMNRAGKKRAGRQLEGREWNEVPS